MVPIMNCLKMKTVIIFVIRVTLFSLSLYSKLFSTDKNYLLGSATRQIIKYRGKSFLIFEQNGEDSNLLSVVSQFLNSPTRFMEDQYFTTWRIYFIENISILEINYVFQMHFTHVRKYWQKYF